MADKSYLENVISSMARAYGLPEPGPAGTRAMYEQAAKAGPFVEGKGYALPLGQGTLGHRVATLEELRASRSPLHSERARVKYPDRATRPAQFQAEYEKSMEDPRNYIIQTRPENQLKYIYGQDAYMGKLRASLLSADRPGKLLSQDPSSIVLNRANIERGMREPLYVVRGPGMGVIPGALPTGAPAGGVANGFHNSNAKIAYWPFALNNSRVPGHEALGHGVLHSRHAPSTPFFDLPANKGQYNNMAREVQADAGEIVRGNYQLTGSTTQNKPEAEELVHKLLEEYRGWAGEPLHDPTANFGGRKGQPIYDSGFTRRKAGMLLDQAPQKDVDKYSELLRRLMDNRKRPTMPVV